MKPDDSIRCPQCGAKVARYRNPLLTVDIIIRVNRGEIVLIRRKNPPPGWALPGGFVDYGESLESAARREALEETGLRLTGLKQFRAYSDPRRDPRHHTVTVVFSAAGDGRPRPGDDAAHLETFALHELPDELAFDHGIILNDFIASLQ